MLMKEEHLWGEKKVSPYPLMACGNIQTLKLF